MKFTPKTILGLLIGVSLALFLIFTYDLVAMPSAPLVPEASTSELAATPIANYATPAGVALRLMAAVQQPATAVLQATSMITQSVQLAPAIQSDEGEWAFTETFTGDPAAPSQDLLPRTFDYVVTHRTLPWDHLKEFVPYPADHGMDCSGPDPALSPLPQHMVVTSHQTEGSQPDPSFFICKNHLMSSMGDVEGYSVTAFWPKQAFDFAAGGVLEFDVNISDDHPRSWWEVLIMPRAELRVGAAQEWLPIDETYPPERILFSFFNNIRNIQVGAGATPPNGILVDESEWFDWAIRHPSDPANQDRRIRRTMRITFGEESITWSIQTADDDFDDYTITTPKLPFTRGLVLFKTHAYTPEKDGNHNNYTFHWDNIRFSGPVVDLYESYEAKDIAYLQANKNRDIGESATRSITLPAEIHNPLLFGQVHNPMRGQVLLRVNNGSNAVLNPAEYNAADCYSTGWKSFVLPLDPSQLHEGINTFTWEIGPRPTCVADWVFTGFSIKSLEVQLDLQPKMYRVYLPLSNTP